MQTAILHESRKFETDSVNRFTPSQLSNRKRNAVQKCRLNVLLQLHQSRLQWLSAVLKRSFNHLIENY